MQEKMYGSESGNETARRPTSCANRRYETEVNIMVI